MITASCTQGGYSLPSAGDAAGSFVKALNASDGKAIAALLDKRTRARWSAQRLERWLKHERAAGRITSLSVKQTGEVPQPAPSASPSPGQVIDTRVPYEVTFRSAAASAPVHLSGNLTLRYSSKDDRWAVAWTRGALWPGIKGARGFSVTYKWPPRARIVDRDGRVLARGVGLGRTYPYGPVGGSTVGHLGKVSADRPAELPSYYEKGTLVGASGIEGAYNARLAGTPLQRLQVTGRGGKKLATLGTKHGRAGRPVHSTLDMPVQHAAEAAYGSTVGGAVVMSPLTGDLLAVVSSAPFDPNNYVGSTDIHPFNRALSGLYPPGSSMKIVTGSAALATGVVTPATILSGPKEYKGVRNFESESFTSLTFADALKYSVNTAFAQVAEKLGASRLHRYATRFGFNTAPSPRLEAATSSYPKAADLGDLLWGSVGQAQDLATPLQMASVAATIADNGVRMSPRIATEQPKDSRRVVPGKVAAEMTSMMQAVVQGGTGTAAQITGVDVAGKTGTAEISVNGKIKDHAWFVAFAPAPAPKVAVSVVVEFGGVGGVVAAPLARSILERVLPLAP